MRTSSFSDCETFGIITIIIIIFVVLFGPWGSDQKLDDVGY